MRAVRLLPAGLALLAGVLGCSRTINYTAGVCDCNPPAVESVLVAPPRGYSVIATSHAGATPAGAPCIKILPPINASTQTNNVPPGNVTVPVNNVSRAPTVITNGSLPGAYHVESDADPLLPAEATTATPLFHSASTAASTGLVV